jgi:hypothetical protein
MTEYTLYPRNVSSEMRVPTYDITVKAVLVGRGQYTGKWVVLWNSSRKVSVTTAVCVWHT